jgi:hypothetical protein
MKSKAKIADQAASKAIAVCMALLLAAPVSAVAQPAQQSTAPAQNTSTTQDAATQDAGAPAAQNGTAHDAQNVAAQSVAGQNGAGQNAPTPAVGTAAAPAETSAGIAASRPAGAVIAPAKQKRRHTILIRVAVVVGAAVAIGTVAALSHASASEPPR